MMGTKGIKKAAGKVEPSPGLVGFFYWNTAYCKCRFVCNRFVSFKETHLLNNIDYKTFSKASNYLTNIKDNNNMRE